MASVTLREVTKEFTDPKRGRVLAVDRANLAIRDGEFIVFVGPSGCGKTTTLRMIAGLERQTSGDILIGNRVVNKLRPAERDIAMVFQDYALYPHMTVRENLAFGLRNLGRPAAEIERKIAEAARMLDIAHLLDRKPKELSGGQRQRVAVGRAIVRSPQVFLFDEPLSNLDAKLRVQMRVELAELHQRLGTTVIYVTHDQVEAMTLGHRIVVMEGGRIQQVDTPQRLYNHPANTFVASFIGSPPMNLWHGTLAGGEGGLWFVAAGGFQLPIPPARQAAYAHLRGQAVILGLRPEHIAPAGGPEGRRAGGEAETGGAVGASVATAQVAVRVVEHLGSEVLVYFQAGDQQGVARLSPDAGVGVGPALLAFHMDRMHLFDAASGQAVPAQAAA